MFNIVYDIGVITDIGNIRKKNEDSVLVLKGNINKDEFSLLLVADGMGGLESGEIASRVVVDAFKKWWDNDLKTIAQENFDLNTIKNSLEVTIENINKEIYSLKEHNIKAGTTLILVFIYKKQYIMCNVGDSRFYLIDNKGLNQISVDQTWCEDEIRAGRMARGEEKSHKMKNVLTSALGTKNNYTLQSEIGCIHDEYILICSDGFYAYLNEDNLYKKIKKYKNCQDALENMKNEIKEKRAHDNLTAVLLNAKRNILNGIIN